VAQSDGLIVVAAPILAVRTGFSAPAGRL